MDKSMVCLKCFATLCRLQSVWNVSLSHSTFMGAENQSQDEYILEKKIPIVSETVLT
jgi:hypothetical protein